ncbi:kinesin-like protein K39 [Acrodontium crateriforme]|uniref:Kinesin-like protein K39 n=1 Tax=Acrodontium crateriforme TaxID=150365 RepID=A0AAQ3M797_9PEZI|nr:kinesin-like protein K39 [Acrodontium crateriforme]
MLSLPLLPPPVTLTTHHQGPFRPLPEDVTINANSAANQAHNPQLRAQQQRRDEERKAHNLQSPLVLLAADEAAIAHRKAAIRHLGAYWIRPPGVSKTLQAMSEEEAERLELEEIQRQERGLADMQAQQQVEEARQRAAETAAQPALEDGEERDLDAEIPDADEDGEEDDDDDDEDEDLDATGEISVSFNETSVVEGSFLDPSWQRNPRNALHQGDEAEHTDVEQMHYLEEAELNGAARDEQALGIERDLDLEQDLDDEIPEADENDYDRDLDDSIPEAGSYQHTDTELEDSDSEAIDSSLLPSAPPIITLPEPQSFIAQSSVRRSTRSTRSNRLQAAPVLPPPMLSSSPVPAVNGRRYSGTRPVPNNAFPLARSRGVGGLQERMRAHLTGSNAETDLLSRSPGTWNLSSSIIESSFIGSSPVMTRNARGRGRGGNARAVRREG